MTSKLNILDRLEDEKGFVKLVLAPGKVVYGKPEIICWSEDEEG